MILIIFKAKSDIWSLNFRDKQCIYIIFNQLDRKKGLQMSNLWKGFYTGMPWNGHLERKTPHCEPGRLLSILLQWHKDLFFILISNLAKTCHLHCLKNGGDESFTKYLWSKVDIIYFERTLIWMANFSLVPSNLFSVLKSWFWRLQMSEWNEFTSKWMIQTSVFIW